jgi:glycosyltransferase involved in cell wall biosynthesis
VIGTKKTVSFVMPVYNGADYLDEAVGSILRQTNPEWRLYLVDDFSADRSGEIIATYSDSRITRI